MSFEEIVQSRLVRKIIDYHVRTHRGKIPGLDDDDIRQELTIELWRKLPRFPTDIQSIDYRFMKYTETIFHRRVFSLHRSLLIARRPGQYRDGLNIATLVPLFDDDQDINKC
jgi:hypothetical protein